MAKSKLTLNENQKKAVQHKAGPLLVVAGAGTGKTRVITERIKYLIKTQKVDPKQILAVTFTEKASTEMLSRLDDAMPLGYEEPWLYTFHAFADRILKAEGLEIGLDSGYKIMSYPEQWLLLQQHLFDFELNYFRPLGNPTKFISAILKFISRLQDENVSVQEFEQFVVGLENRESLFTDAKRAEMVKIAKRAGNTNTPENTEKNENYETEVILETDALPRWQELLRIYQKYEALKLKHSKMDFGDLILWTTRLFKNRPLILKKYQRQFKHILVDEFQDTNYAQYELIKLLFPPEDAERKTSKKTENDLKSTNKVEIGVRSLLVVGDDSQSIYKFRGAAVSNILEFQKDYPTSKMITLLENYRSSQEILDPAYKLIQNNNPDTLEAKLGISKELKSLQKRGGITPEAFIAKTVEDEVDFVVRKILEILGREPTFNYKDFAILARANNHLDAFIFALRKYSLPYQLVGNRGLYDREEVRDILALLKVIVNVNDPISLYRVLNISTFEISNEEIAKILSDTKFKKLDMWDVIKRSIDTKIISLYEKISQYQQLITDKTPVELVHELVTDIGYIKQFVAEETVENQLSIRNLNLFLDRVKKFELAYRADTKEIPTIVNFLDYIELMIEAGENPAQAEIEDIDTINLLTVHASKGLEFPVVFMINLVGDRFPTRDRKEEIEIPDNLIKESLPVGNSHLQEERRLFYVGMTRAQKYLYLTAAKNYGGKRDKVLSGYVTETGIKPKELEEVNTRKAQDSLFGVSSEFRSPEAKQLGKHTPNNLSYSKISDYKTCPLLYRYKYVLYVPTPPNHALSFGITIHDTLRDFHSAQLAKENVTLTELLQMYEKNWQPLGYPDKKHREIRFESGKQLLAKYYENNKQLAVMPVALEQSFNIKIGGIKFFGRIDRIDPLADGGVEIIDYKTGQAKTQKEVDADDQVAFYAIAVKEALHLEPKKMSLYFVEQGEKVTTTRTQAQLEKKRADVVKVIKEMQSGNFEATPGKHCSWCDFRAICPFAFKG